MVHRCFVDYLPISIHAPVKGATRPEPLFVATVRHFNPRSREGSDFPCSSLFLSFLDFNPRSREGSDVSANYQLSISNQFQSTLP